MLTILRYTDTLLMRLETAGSVHRQTLRKSLARITHQRICRQTGLPLAQHNNFARIVTTDDSFSKKRWSSVELLA